MNPDENPILGKVDIKEDYLLVMGMWSEGFMLDQQ